MTELMVSGMTCGNCARHVTEAIQSVAGVQSATVNLEQKRASVRWTNSGDAAVAGVIGAIRDAGYEASEIKAGPHEHEHDHVEMRLAGWQLNLWIGVLGMAPLMIGEWVFGLGLARWFQWLSFGLAGVVQVFSGAQFYRGAWRQLKVGSSNMDTLVALGSTTAFAYSVWALFSGLPGHVYFMESASIITLVSVGHWLESRVSARASSALQKLLNLAPSVARRRGADGSETEVAVGELKLGDLVALRPGDRVPTDGEVVEGESSVDEAMLTGESAPVDKTAGTRLYAGTVNLNGRLVMRVVATGEETALAHIVAAVQRAQSSRADIQRLGDQVSSVFVPVVSVVALAAGLWWGLAPESAREAHAWLGRFLWHAHPPEGRAAAAFIIAAGVLIIACPCAMGLATPAAIMAASNAAAQRGILVRDGVALERAGKVTAVLFDKTGTLTVGKPTVAKVLSLVSKVQSQGDAVQRSEVRGQKSEVSSSVVLRLAAGLARHSSHPISQAVAKLSVDALELADWEEVRGGGVTGKVQSPESKVQSRVRLGSLRWLEESGMPLEEGKAFVQEWSAQGATIVGLAVEKSLLGLFAVKDAVKPGARAVVEQLQA